MAEEKPREVRFATLLENELTENGRVEILVSTEKG